MMWHNDGCTCAGCDELRAAEETNTWEQSHVARLVRAAESEDPDEIADVLELLDLDGDDLAETVAEACDHLAPDTGALLRDVTGC